MSGRLATLVQPVFAAVRPAAAVEDTLARVVSVAREPWPELSLADEVFLPFLLRHIPEPPETPEGLLQLHLADLYLLCAYRRGDPAAARILESRHLPRLRAALGRLRVAPAEAQDIAQSVCKRLLEETGANYSGRGELVAWMVIAAVRAASTLRRKGKREVELDDELFEEDDVSGDDADLAYLKRQYREQFKLAFAEALQALSARDRTLLRYHTVDRLNIAQIGTLYNVHRATVARWLAAAREQLLTDTRKALMRRADIAASEVDSVLRLIQTQLDISLRRALGPIDEPG